MGQVVNSCFKEKTNMEVVAGVDINAIQNDSFPVYKSINDIEQNADVIIDFSHPSALSDVLSYAQNKKINAVIATTGLNNEHIELINKASENTAVFFSYNMSIGVNLIADLAAKATVVLGDDFDIEIVEQHHNQKLDAPSGTAIMLADAVVNAANKNYHFEYDRHSKRKKRDKSEIGMHSIRGGTITGEHEVIFAGKDEIITISHSARSKEIFAVGAINAAVYVAKKECGLFNMNDLISNR